MATIAAGAGLLERQRELGVLSDALASARRGAGVLALVEGPAGIGKSGLLAATRREAESEGMNVLEGQGLELEQEAPFLVATDLFAAPLASVTAARRDRLLVGQAALAGSLLEPGGPTTGDPQALIRGLYWLTVSLATQSWSGRRAGRRPLAVVIDDAQWADRPSMAFLAHLAARVESVPVALVFALRAGETPAAADVVRALRDLPRCVRLAPAALSEEAVGRLVADELPDPEPEFVAACAHVSGGNPFLTRELARALRDDGVVPGAQSVTEVRRLVPTSVLHSVLTRLSRLGNAAERLATAVAVLSDGSVLRHAARLAQLEVPEAEAAADQLAEAGILMPGEPLRFAHPLIATTVHSDLPAFGRARAHRAAAALLAQDGAPIPEVAAHLLLSTPGGDPWVAATLREAASRALAQGDSRAAARLLARALAEPPPISERPGVLLELAAAEALHGARAARSRLAEALDLLKDSPARAGALRALSRVQLILEDDAAAAEALREVLAGIDPGDPSSQEILAEYLSVNTFRAPLHAEAQARLEPIIAAARRGTPPSDPGLLSHLALRLALAGEAPETIRELGERATADGPLADVGSHGLLTGILVQALCCVDELDTAERIADEAVVVARRHGSLFAAASGSYHRAIARYHRGTLADCLADLDQALAPSREGWPAGAIWAFALQAHAQLERGDLTAAREALSSSSPSPDSMEHAILLFAHARVALAAREPAAALSQAAAAGRHLAEGFGIDHAGLVPWRRTAALAALALGDRDRAQSLVDEALHQARSCRVPRVIGLALRTAAAVADRSQQIELLSEAADVLEPSPSSLERAHALAELGSAMRRAGRRDEAQSVLRTALQLAARMGALPLAQAAGDELRATGARPRRTAFTGADALTPAERRVAQLAAQGLTNREIAEQLFVTIKTVQTHLAHAYRKLGISSRRRLPTVLDDGQPEW
jgi:DNA-binding CsgD family transcriptional regulator